jgi:integrase
MGRTGSGIEIRPGSIRFTFLPGRPTLQVNGKPLKPTPANLAYARRLAAEIRQKVALGTFSMLEYFPANGNAGAPLTVAAWLDTWLAAQRVEHSTRAGYSSAVKFWKAAFGHKSLRALMHSDILGALAARPELSGKTVNNYADVLHQAMALAVRDKLLHEDPSAGLPRATWQRDPPDPFTLEETERIIAALPDLPLVEFWFFTGMRTSEIAGLHWSSVDLASGYVRVQEALVRGQEKDRTKTGVSRDVLLNSRAMVALQRQRGLSQLAGEHVWIDPRYGTPWTEERAFRRSYWTPTLRRLGIRYRRPYNMRHTYATMMLMAGRTPAWCAGQLGHSVEVFLRTYARWLGGAQDAREVAAFETWLSDTSPILPRSSEKS